MKHMRTRQENLKYTLYTRVSTQHEESQILEGRKKANRQTSENCTASGMNSGGECARPAWDQDSCRHKHMRRSFQRRTRLLLTVLKQAGRCLAVAWLHWWQQSDRHSAWNRTCSKAVFQPRSCYSVVSSTTLGVLIQVQLENGIFSLVLH